MSRLRISRTRCHASTLQVASVGALGRISEEKRPQPSCFRAMGAPPAARSLSRAWHLLSDIVLSAATTTEASPLERRDTPTSDPPVGNHAFC